MYYLTLSLGYSREAIVFKKYTRTVSSAELHAFTFLKECYSYRIRGVINEACVARRQRTSLAIHSIFKSTTSSARVSPILTIAILALLALAALINRNAEYVITDDPTINSISQLLQTSKHLKQCRHQKRSKHVLFSTGSGDIISEENHIRFQYSTTFVTFWNSETSLSAIQFHISIWSDQRRISLTHFERFMNLT